MSFDELVLSDILNLPIKSGYKGFKNTITEKLNIFLKAIESLSDNDFGIPDIYIVPGFVKRVQRKFVSGLLETIEHYYNGYPEKAYRTLEDTLRGDEKNFDEILKVGQYGIGQNFYRLRYKKDNFPLLPIDMFHIPFEIRGKVTTQRYSIPGFPSLYLGSTIYVAWEELSRPNINEFQVVRLETVKPIDYIDLTRPDLTSNIKTREVYRYLMTWPLIACCSVKVQNHDDIFKPEYIVPQLLLQWVRCNSKYDGIVYNSTLLNPNRQAKEYNTNIVLPVKENKDKGHCKKLKSLFNITTPISYQLKELCLGGSAYIGGGFSENEANYIELINGRKYPYANSVFGDLEGFLKNMPLNKL